MKLGIMSKDMILCPEMGNDSYCGAASNCIALLKQSLSAMPTVSADHVCIRMNVTIFPSLIVGTEAEIRIGSLVAKDLTISMICDQSPYHSNWANLSGNVGTCLY